MVGNIIPQLAIDPPPAAALTPKLTQFKLVSLRPHPLSIHPRIHPFSLLPESIFSHIGCDYVIQRDWHCLKTSANRHVLFQRRMNAFGFEEQCVYIT